MEIIVPNKLSVPELERGQIILFDTRLFVFSEYSKQGMILAYPALLFSGIFEIGSEREEFEAVDLATFTLIYSGRVFHTSLNDYSTDQTFDISRCCFTSIVERIDKAFSCKLCGYRYQHEYHLRKHMEIHSQEQLHSHCPYCSKKFFNETDLWMHLGYKTHSVDPEKEIRLEQNSTGRSDNGIVYFKCSNCSTKFSTADQFLEHMALRREIALTVDTWGNAMKLEKYNGPLFICNLCLFPVRNAEEASRHATFHAMASEMGRNIPSTLRRAEGDPFSPKEYNFTPSDLE